MQRDDLLSLWCAMTACEHEAGIKGVHQLKSDQWAARAPLADAANTTPPTATRTDELAEAALKSLRSSVRRNGRGCSASTSRSSGGAARAGIAAARGRRAPRRNMRRELAQMHDAHARQVRPFRSSSDRISCAGARADRSSATWTGPTPHNGTSKMVNHAEARGAGAYAPLYLQIVFVAS